MAYYSTLLCVPRTATQQSPLVDAFGSCRAVIGRADIESDAGDARTPFVLSTPSPRVRALHHSAIRNGTANSGRRCSPAESAGGLGPSDRGGAQ